MSVLDKIVERKRERLGDAKARIPLSELKSKISCIEKPRDFISAIKRDSGRIRLIAEIKKASPSKGVIREDFDPVKIARIYEGKSVDAISVLTEEDFFSGDLKYIPSVKGATTRPVLRKDFIFDEYQLFEARANSADAVLLIAALLHTVQAGEYIHLCKELGLAALFEIHDHEELEKALRVDAGIIGINNRSLKTMTIDLNTTFLLKKDVPSGKIVVSESGINTRDDALRLENGGVDAMLIGTSIMESGDIGKKIDELRG